jgi:ubiquinone/menaquinone biosynthesis C-methylase UbiE
VTERGADKAEAAAYQDNYSSLYAHEVMDPAARRLKAEKTLSVISDHFGNSLAGMRALEVGCASGGVSMNLCGEFASYAAVDIDARAIAAAQAEARASNARVEFATMNSEQLEFADACFDLVICSHVYEHVPHPARMFDEIYRVLRPGGACYFAAGNRLMWMEPHHHLPLLAALPKPAADLYLRLFRGRDRYYENHFTLFGLRALARRFEIIDYTRRIVDDPVRFRAVDQVPAGSARQRIAQVAVRAGYWLFPTYIWLLRKPS